MNIAEIGTALKEDGFKNIVEKLYGESSAIYLKQLKRYQNAIDAFYSNFGDRNNLEFFSAPGRSEVAGNHTDHNAGKVLAAAINLDAIAAVSKTSDKTITIKSQGYDIFSIDCSRVDKKDDELYTTTALVKGVCEKIKEEGYIIGGFDAYITSDVLKGSGLSSSAAFEVLIVTIVNNLYCNQDISPIKAAQIAQYAENVYFGKPSGLMDQLACSVGGFAVIDFKDSQNPIVEQVDFDFEKSGLALVITDTGGSHDDLNEDYAAINNEMRAVAHQLGRSVMRDINMDDVIDNIVKLRQNVNDRAILRAIHFLNDNLIVDKQAQALKEADIDLFLSLVIKSGQSSWMHLQNCYVSRDYENQGVSLALAVSERILTGKGAYRVHGGGFAGTIQAFMPKEMLDEYIEKMERVFGADCCYNLSVRSIGACKVQL